MAGVSRVLPLTRLPPLEGDPLWSAGHIAHKGGDTAR